MGEVSRIHHIAGALKALAALLVLTTLIACANEPTHGESERGVCQAIGQATTISLGRHGGYVTRCALPE